MCVCFSGTVVLEVARSDTSEDICVDTNNIKNERSFQIYQHSSEMQYEVDDF